MTLTIEVKKQADDRYSVVVTDTDDIIDVLSGACRTYSVIYNPANSKESLKAKIEALIADNKALVSAEDTIKADIQATIESIGVE